MSLPTLTDYFQDVFLSVWIRSRGLDAKTESSYRESLGWWRKLTSNPPVNEITQKMVADFMTTLAAQPGKKKGTTFFASSLQKHARQLDTVLKTCGPASRHNRRGQGLVEREPPFFDSPKVPKHAPAKDWDLSEIHAQYRACASMELPKVEGVSSPDWWRCLFVVAYFTGLRIGSLVQIQFSHIHKQVLTVPPEIAKGDKGSRHWLPTIAMEHIERIRTDRAEILHVPRYSSARRTLYDHLEQLQEFAGIEKHRRWRFHSLRKTHATILANLSSSHQEDLRIAQRSCNHSSLAITLGSYASGSMEERRVFEAVERMPSPVPPELVVQPIAVQLPQAPSEPTRRRSWMDRFA